MTADCESVSPEPAVGGLPRHRLRVVLVQPDIPQNTGNIARLCSVTGVQLHLVRPLGFFLSDARLRRSGMDYWQKLNPVIHDDLPAFEQQLAGGFHLFTSRGRTDLWNAEFTADDWLIFGSESSGLPQDFVRRHAAGTVKIPMRSGERCLNVSTAAGIAVYTALRQIKYGGQKAATV